MKTRRMRNKRKTRKGGGTEFDRTKNIWVSTSKSKDRNSNHSQYSLAEATFLNRLKVTEYHGVIIRVNGREHRYPNKPALLRDHDVITEKLGEGFLLEDITKHEFDTLFLEMNKTIQSLRIALEKRKEENKIHPDSEINKHRDSEILLRDLLGAIEVFLVPYREQEERFKPKQLIKRKITPKPFTFKIDTETEVSEPERETEREPEREIEREPERESEPEKYYETSHIDAVVIPNKFFVTTVVNDIVANSFALIAKGDKMILLVGGNELNIITLGTKVESHDVFDVEAPIDYLTTAMIHGKLFIYIVIENTLYKIPFKNASEIGERMPMISLKISGLSYDLTQGLVCLHSNRLYKYKEKSEKRMIEDLPVRDISSKNIDINERFTAIADTGNHRIIIINNKTKTYLPIGTGMGCADGISPQFNSPEDVCFMLDSSILVADTGNHCIRRLYQTKEGWITETIAGTPTVPGNKHGSSQVAQFHFPCKVKVQDDSTFFVIDRGNTCIKKVELYTPGLERAHFLDSLPVSTFHINDLVELIHQENPKHNGIQGLVTALGDEITVFFNSTERKYPPSLLRVIPPPTFHLYDTIQIVHTKTEHNGVQGKVMSINGRQIKVFNTHGINVTLPDVYLQKITSPKLKQYDKVVFLSVDHKLNEKIGAIMKINGESYVIAIRETPKTYTLHVLPIHLLKLPSEPLSIKDHVFSRIDKTYGVVHEIIPENSTTVALYIIKTSQGFSEPSPAFVLEKINPKIGKRIQLVNYQGEKAKFNGKQGTVKEYDSEKDIYLIAFDNGKDGPINGRYVEFI